MDYIKKEIPFVNYVYHPGEADITILITSEATASGSYNYQIVFEGNSIYKNRTDTLNFKAKLNISDDELRKAFVRKIKLGLVQFISGSPLADNLSINFIKNDSNTISPPDNWDYWVFTLSGNGYFSGEKSSNSISLWNSLSADRITEDLKLDFSLSNNYSEDIFTYDTLKVTSISRSNYIYARTIFSIDEHFSAGLFGSAYQSTYSNIDFAYYLNAGAEYDIYPYSLSISRQFSFIYQIGYKYMKYFYVTIYDKNYDHLAQQELSAAYIFKDTWGTINTSITFDNYLYDFSKKNLNIYTSLSLYLFSGFYLNIWGSFYMVHGQIYLPKEGATPDEVLLRRRELETNYRYYASIGLSYTFGSIYNNIVNPRFSR